VKIHSIAAIFPPIEDDELQALADDIRENGLKVPIVRFEGMVLDGRNRLAACTIAQVEPTFIDFTGTRLEALAHSWSINRTRRHLNSSQAAVIAYQ
jgi:ParB-like chromosome segregation protein Spo0J